MAIEGGFYGEHAPTPHPLSEQIGNIAAGFRADSLQEGADPADYTPEAYLGKIEPLLAELRLVTIGDGK